jgi:hypothetical protein
MRDEPPIPSTCPNFDPTTSLTRFGPSPASVGHSRPGPPERSPRRAGGTGGPISPRTLAEIPAEHCAEMIRALLADSRSRTFNATV